MKKNWIYLVLLVLIVLTLFLIFIPKKSGTKARLTIKGEVIKEFDLNQSEVITENFSSYGADITIEIKNGAIRVLDSDCPDKICVHTGYISNITQTAVCMPNKAVLEIIE